MIDEYGRQANSGSWSVRRVHNTGLGEAVE
jgi:hypothetical protein